MSSTPKTRQRSKQPAVQTHDTWFSAEVTFPFQGSVKEEPVEIYWERGRLEGPEKVVQLLESACLCFEGVWLGDPEGSVYGGTTEHIKHAHHIFEILRRIFPGWKFLGGDISPLPPGGVIYDWFKTSV